MRSTGIVRKVDELGRIVIPIDIREQLNIMEKDQLEIFLEGECIILKRPLNYCVFCGKREGTIEFKNRKICEICDKEYKKMRH